MPVWFEGTQEIDCSLERTKLALANPSEYFVGTVRLMPGLTTVELVESGEDHVHIRTNEGLMKRTRLSREVGADSVVIEFDEVYEAGTKITVTSHYRDEFKAHGTGVTHNTTVTSVEAPGFLGFFYRHLGKSSIGNAVLASHKGHLESLD